MVREETEAEREARINKIRHAFDQVAEGYDHRGAPWFDQTAAALLRASQLMPQESALDVATGTGKVAIRLAKASPHSKIVGVDLSPKMIDVAKEKGKGLPNLRFQAADFDELNSKHEFDLLTCSFGIFFVKEMARTLRRFAQQLKPGGRLVLSTFVEGSFEPFNQLFFSTYSRFGEEPAAPAWLRVASPALINELFASAGLPKPKIEEVDLSFPLQSAEHWWEIIFNAGYRRLLEDLSPEQFKAFKRQHIEEVKSLLARPEGKKLNLKVLITSLKLEIEHN